MPGTMRRVSPSGCLNFEPFSIDTSFLDAYNKKLVNPLVDWKKRHIFAKTKRQLVMTTKMTIELETSLWEKLISYAHVKSSTVSDVVRAQLEILLFNAAKEQEKPVSSRLRGVIKLPEDFDYKKELENRAL